MILFKKKKNKYVPVVAEGKWTVVAAVVAATVQVMVAEAAAAADAEPAAANSSSAAAGCSIRCWAFRWAAVTALRPEPQSPENRSVESNEF